MTHRILPLLATTALVLVVTSGLTLLLDDSYLNPAVLIGAVFGNTVAWYRDEAKKRRGPNK